MSIHIFTTGGTIDKVYFDANSEYEVGEPEVERALRDIRLSVDLTVTSLLRKDSLELTDDDRTTIHSAVAKADESHIIITHGTDTMVDTAKVLSDIPDKTIVLTGALQPAVFKTSDALFNIGCAFGAVLSAEPGVYIAMSGKVFPWDKVVKDRAQGRFIDTPGH